MNPENPLLLLAPRVTDDSVAVWRAAIAEGWTTRRLPSWRVPEDLLTTGQEIVIYAEPLFAEAVADQIGFVLIEPPPPWLPGLPHRYLHREVGLMRLSEVNDFPIFVKPAEGKVFEPKVYGSIDELPAIDRIGDIPVLTSTPVDFTLEVRFFVLDGLVATTSPYWRNGELARFEDGTWPFLDGEKEGALAFVNALLTDSDVEFPPAFVLDVGLISASNWAVIEGNPCWGAGLYGCDPMAVLKTGQRALVPKPNLSASDLRWVSKRADILQ